MVICFGALLFFFHLSVSLFHRKGIADCGKYSFGWYVSNFTLHNDLQIPFITEEIKRYSTIYYRTRKQLCNSIKQPVNRGLKWQWPSDQREEEE
jgi:hypothetical protein